MNKILPDSFINPLFKINKYIAIQTICSKFLEYYNNTLSLPSKQTDENYGEAILAYSTIYSLAKKWNLKIENINLTTFTN